MKNMTISEFAKIGGVGVETIRYYQRQGILNIPALEKEFNAKKIRRYQDEDIRRLRFILAAKKAGFTLKEIKKLLQLNAKTDHEQVRRIAQKRITQLDIEITERQKARESLYRLATQCQNADLDPCPILVAFEQ